MTRLIPSIAVLLAVVGCSGPELPDAAVSLDWRQLQCSVVSRGNEWRQARKVAPGHDLALDLGPVRDGTVLRLGILAEEASRRGVDARVFVGKSQVARLKASRADQWLDRRVSLPVPQSGPEPCTVLFDSDVDFWLAPCELVNADAKLTSIVLILIDALRQDRLGCYGCPRPTSPNMDALAKDAIRFTELVPQSSWTRPSVASLLTSTYPSVHGAEDRPDLLRANLPLLAEALDRHGYETNLLMGNLNCLPVWGFGEEFFRGFDFSVEKPGEHGDADVPIVETAVDILQFATNRNSFLYVHLMSPHGPYNPPPPYDAMFWSSEEGRPPLQVLAERTKATYDGEIAFVDMLVGRLVGKLKELGTYDSSLIVLTSDHGEQLGEHGAWGHGFSLFEEEIRVPLLVKLPLNEHAGEVRTTLQEMIDLAPTILESVGAPPEPRFQGRSFLDVIRGAERRPNQAGYASLHTGVANLRMAKTTTLKCLYRLPSQEMTYFDLLKDPAEQSELAEVPPLGRALAAHATRLSARGAEGLHIVITDVSASNRVIEGRVVAEGLEEAGAEHPSNEVELVRDGSEVRFKLRMRRPDMARPGMRFWLPKGGEENCFHFRASLAGDRQVRVELWADGQAIPESDVRFGAAGERRAMPASFVAKEAMAPADSYDPAHLSPEFIVYIYYIDPTAQLRDDQLAPETRETLRALGYVE